LVAGLIEAFPHRSKMVTQFRLAQRGGKGYRV
jgi:hypothetical protein